MAYKYEPMFQLGEDTTEYYLLTKDHVSVGEFEGHPILKVDAEGLRMLANQAFRDVNFLLRPEHNNQVAKILSDPEASDNDNIFLFPVHAGKFSQNLRNYNSALLVRLAGDCAG